MLATTPSLPRTETVQYAVRSFPRIRPFSVELVHPSVEGFSPGHEYVRRFWAAALGKGAPRNLLELFMAGLRQRIVHEPPYLRVLMSAGLVEVAGDCIRMTSRVPPLPSPLVSRLGPGLRSDHRRWAEGLT